MTGSNKGVVHEGIVYTPDNGALVARRCSDGKVLWSRT